MDKATSINLAKRFSEKIVTLFPVKSIILFGSYSNDTAKLHSDIDIAVVVENFEGDFLKTSKQLFTLSRDIDLRIEPILIDLQDDPSGFLREINKNGTLIYQSA